jgi:hypothetical protein
MIATQGKRTPQSRLGKPPVYNDNRLVASSTHSDDSSNVVKKGNRYVQGVTSAPTQTTTNNEFEKAKKLVGLYAETESKKQALLDREIKVKEIQIEERHQFQQAYPEHHEVAKANEMAILKSNAYMRDNTKIELFEKYEQLVKQGRTRAFILKLFPSFIDFMEDDDIEDATNNDSGHIHRRDTKKRPPRPPRQIKAVTTVPRIRREHVPEAVARAVEDFEVDNLDDDDDYVFDVADASSTTSWSTLDLQKQPTTKEKSSKLHAPIRPIPQKEPRGQITEDEPTPKRKYNKQILPIISDSPAAGTRSRTNKKKLIELKRDVVCQRKKEV